MLNILVADDDLATLTSLRALLSTRGHDVTTARDGSEALGRLRERAYDLLVSDVNMTGLDGLSLLRHVRRAAPDTDVILITGFGNIPDAIAAMRARAADYITKPFDLPRFLRQVEHIEQARLLRARALLPGDGGAIELVGQSPDIMRVREMLPAVATSSEPLCIHGESGTGKELVARLVHGLGPRASRPFVLVTGSEGDHLFGEGGHLVAAQGGTLLLDHIEELSEESQARLLHALGPEGEARAVRLIIASERDLGDLVRAARLRDDLARRLRVFEVALPPLRDRPADLPLLVERFLRQGTTVEAPLTVSGPAWAALVQHGFPGNVRELENAIKHGVALARARGAREIELQDLPTAVREPLGDTPGEPPTLPRALEQFEREYIRRALSIAGGEKKRAARILGISRKSLYKKLERHRDLASTRPK